MIRARNLPIIITSLQADDEDAEMTEPEAKPAPKKKAPAKKKKVGVDDGLAKRVALTYVNS